MEDKSSRVPAGRWSYWWRILAVTLLATKAAAALVFKSGAALSAYRNAFLVFLLLSLLSGAAISVLNAISSRQAIRVFWSLLAASFVFWALNQWAWVYYSVVRGMPLPPYLAAAIPLLCRMVFLTAAAGYGSHLESPQDRPYKNVLNLLALLFLLLVLFEFLRLPFSYDDWDTKVLLQRQFLYLAMNLTLFVGLGTALITAQSAWKVLYWHLLGASVLYTLGSLLSNLAISPGKYVTGLHDLVLTAAVYWYVWIAFRGRESASQLESARAVGTPASNYTGMLVILALTAVPIVAIWELYRNEESEAMRLGRLGILVWAIAFAIFVALFALYVRKHKLMQEISVAHDRLRTAVMSGRSVLWERDLKTQRSFWFGDLLSIFGIPSDTLSAQEEELHRYIHPADRERVAAAMKDAQLNGGPFSAEFRTLQQDGTTRWASAAGKFYYRKDGTPERMLGVTVDIHERKLAEEARYESEQRLRAVVDSAMDAIIVVNEEQRIVLFNPASEKMFCCTASDAIGSSIERFIPSRFRSAHEEHIRRFGESGVTNRGMGSLGTLSGIRINGEEFPVEASISLADTGGQRLFTVIIRDVSERQRAQEALRASEQTLRLAFRAARMYAYQWDASTDVIERSSEFVDIVGTDQPLKTRRRDLLTQVHPDDRDRLAAAFVDLTPENSRSDLQYRLLRPDGSVIWLERRARGIFDEEGQLEKVVGVVADITARKQAEVALRESEERFRRVVGNISDAVMVDDVAGSVVYANDRFLHLFGLEREQLTNLNLEDYVAPEYRKDLRERHDRRIRGEAVTSHFEYEGLRTDGTRKWLEVDVVPVTDDTGKLVGTQSAIRDITERKKAEHILRESEERFRLVANTAPVMIWMAGPDQLRNYSNLPWLEFTGRPAEAELGKGWTEGVHPEDLNMCLDVYAKAFDKRESFKTQYRLRRHDGEYRWLFDSGIPRFDRGSSFVGYIGSCVDITSLKLAEEALANVGRKLIEAHEEERTHIARELHDDINQRIAVLAINMDQLKQQLPESAIDLHDRLRHTNQHLLDISADIQALSHRLHSSKLEYLGLAKAAHGFCREFSAQKEVTIEFRHSDIPQNIPKQVALCLFRVLQEALQNAAKYSGTRAFKVQMDGSPHRVQLTVSDSGVGFDPQDVVNCQGLGLISMRERVQLVGGQISIGSAVGRGTTIEVRVPLKLEEEQVVGAR